MKHTPSTLLAALAGFFTTGSAALGALTFVAPGNSASVYYTHNTGSFIHSYDWGSDGNLYYGTNDFYSFDGIYRYDGNSVATIKEKTTTGDYSGASVVAIGSSIYFNDSTMGNVQRIYRYDIGDASTISKTATNYALFANGNDLVTTGSGIGGGTDFLSYAGGDLNTTTLTLGNVDGYSGPLAFGPDGSLYYGVGFGEPLIFFWSAGDVAAAQAGTPLGQAGSWNYGSAFPNSGATSMLVDSNGDLMVTLTYFSGASDLVKFDKNGNHEIILSSSGRLGELRMHDGNYYISEENNIYQFVPEPSSLLLSLLAGGLIVSARRRN